MHTFFELDGSFEPSLALPGFRSSSRALDACGAVRRLLQAGRLGIRLSVFAIGRTARRDVLIRGHFGDQPIGPDFRFSAWEQDTSSSSNVVVSYRFLPRLGCSVVPQVGLPKGCLRHRLLVNGDPRQAQAPENPTAPPATSGDWGSGWGRDDLVGRVALCSASGG